MVRLVSPIPKSICWSPNPPAPENALFGDRVFKEVLEEVI